MLRPLALPAARSSTCTSEVPAGDTRLLEFPKTKCYRSA